MSSARRPSRSITAASIDGRGRGVGADRAGELADRRLLEGVAQAAQVAVGLEREAGEAQPERRRLGVDAVGAPDAERLGVLARLRDERVAVARSRPLIRIAPASTSCSAERGVEHVGGGEPVVDPAPLVADRRRRPRRRRRRRRGWSSRSRSLTASTVNEARSRQAAAASAGTLPVPPPRRRWRRARPRASRCIRRSSLQTAPISVPRVPGIIEPLTRRER